LWQYCEKTARLFLISDGSNLVNEPFSQQLRSRDTVCGIRYARVQRADAEDARMGTDRTWADRRSRTTAGL
jgi:hypothetical protein